MTILELVLPPVYWSMAVISLPAFIKKCYGEIVPTILTDTEEKKIGWIYLWSRVFLWEQGHKGVLGLFSELSVAHHML